MFVERVSHKELRHASWRNWHILEKMKREEKKGQNCQFPVY